MFVDIAYAAEEAAKTAAEGAQQQPNMIIPMVLVFLVFYLLFFRPEQKKAKEQATFLNSIEKGAEVITTGGILGKVVGVTDKVVTLEIAEKLRIKLLKSSVLTLQKKLNETK